MTPLRKKPILGLLIQQGVKMLPKKTATIKQHCDLIEKIRTIKGVDFDSDDRILLKSVLLNHRSDGGMKLSPKGFTLCTEYNLYEFVEFEIDYRKSHSSLFSTSLDRVCKMPYHIKGLKCFISDPEVFTLLTMYNDDFDFLFENFT